jgi:superfamily I DNA and/or RNA helicase
MGLSVSLFERLQLMGITPMLLDTQYRMHPVIAQFPSMHFYGSCLKSHPSPEERLAPLGLHWPQEKVKKTKNKRR